MTTVMYTPDCPWCDAGGSRYCRSCSGSSPPAPETPPKRLETLRPGQRCNWRGRAGTVRSVHMLPPRMQEPMAYCVMLDEAIVRPEYRGQIVPAAEVHAT